MKKIEKSTESEYLRVVRKNLIGLKDLAEKALAQLSDGDFHYKTDEESNSIAILIQHISGNMRSRFTDFLTTDGEKPDRKRDTEFEDIRYTREQLMTSWESSWQIILNTLETLKEEDLTKIVFIRNEPHSVIEALNRQLAHYAYHIGQMVFVAKHIKRSSWNSLSIPKGKSEEVNREMSRRKPKT